MKVTAIKYISIVALMVALSLTSCNIKEDMSNCSGTFLLDYTAYSNEILDEIKDDSRVFIYVFDASDVCAEILSYTYGELEESDFEFEVPIAYRGCNVLVWHGSDAADYNDNSMQIGEPIDNFYLRLITDKDGGLSHVPAPLWAGLQERVDFCASITRHRIFMTRLHTEVNVALGIQQLDGTVVDADMSDFLVSIESSNNVYHCDYSLCDECCMITYDNADEVTEGETLSYGHAGTLRLAPDHSTKLYITQVESGERVIVQSSEQIDLVKFMLDSNGGESGNTAADQRFLDLNKVWDLRFVVSLDGYVAVSLDINGWTVWFNNADLD